MIIPDEFLGGFIALGILLFSVLLAKGITIYLRRSLMERVGKDHTEIIVKVLSYSIIGAALLTILPMVGVNPSGLLVAGGILAIVIGFASQSIVGNLISGLFLMVERPIKIGDTVNIDGVVGYVEDIRIISTTIKTFDGIYVRIPNEKVFTTNIINYLANPVRRFEYIVGIRYSDDADKAIAIINDVLNEHPLVLHKPPSQAFVDNLGDNSVNIIVKVWTPSSEWWGVKTVLLWKIKTTLEENGIEIPFPQRTVWFANELNTTYPKSTEPET